MHRLLPILPLVALLAGCASPPVPGCPAGLEPATVAELYLGRNAGDRLRVTDADWARFLDEEVTPRFPDGLTVTDSAGQWRNGPAAPIVREPGKVLTIVLPQPPGDSPARLSAVVDAYKRRFDQQSVLRVFSTACVAF